MGGNPLAMRRFPWTRAHARRRGGARPLRTPRCGGPFASLCPSRPGPARPRTVSDIPHPIPHPPTNPPTHPPTQGPLNMLPLPLPPAPPLLPPQASPQLCQRTLLRSRTPPTSGGTCCSYTALSRCTAWWGEATSCTATESSSSRSSRRGGRGSTSELGKGAGGGGRWRGEEMPPVLLAVTSRFLAGPFAARHCPIAAAVCS